MTTGLVLEGGGMRGVFTAGVLDALLDYDISFPYVIGTSAGSVNGCNFIAGQRGRSRYMDIDLQVKHPYVGFLPSLRGNGVIDMEFLFNIAPRDYYPFDFEAYSNSKTRLVIVSTSAHTGQAVYSEEKRNFSRFIDACRSSCSLPVVCPMWQLDGEPMVDGGLSDPIAYERAFADGCDKLVVVLTKDASYRKPDKPQWVPRGVYKKYPELKKALVNYNINYNKCLDHLHSLENGGRLIVVRPESMCGVDRTTNKSEPLEALYAEGLKQGKDLALKLTQ